MMVHYQLSNSALHLQQILALQSANLRHTLPEEVESSQGFVTVKHDLESLTHIANSSAPVVALDGTKLVGYTLAMSPACYEVVPSLKEMFVTLDSVHYQDKLISHTNYLVMGQICIHADYRGQGVFEGMYKLFFETYKGKYDYIVTEIAKRNIRSLKAHEKVGFKAIHEYHEAGMEDWVVVIY